MDSEKDPFVGPKPWTPIAPRPAEEQSWQVGLCSGCCEDSGTYLTNCFCTPCMVYEQRKVLIQDKWEDYVCCNGTLLPNLSYTHFTNLNPHSSHEVGAWRWKMSLTPSFFVSFFHAGVCFGDKIPCQKECPQCCLCCEACCCSNCAIHGNRNYLLEKYWIKVQCIHPFDHGANFIPPFALLCLMSVHLFV
jgi:hypothetical protein